MGLIFREEHVRLILEGVKTQTRRLHKRPLKVGRVYRIKRSWVKYTEHRIRITKRFRQCLGDITPDDALKEGGYSVEEFKEVWKRINRSYDPSTLLWVYEFQLVPVDGFHPSIGSGYSLVPSKMFTTCTFYNSTPLFNRLKRTVKGVRVEVEVHRYRLIPRRRRGLSRPRVVGF